MALRRPGRRTLPRRVLVALAALGVVLAACAGDDDSAEGSAPPTTADPAETPLEETSYGQLMFRQLSGEASEVELALTKFALAFGPVPGALDIAPDGTEPQTGTGALRAVDRVWDELDEQQQAAIEERLEPWFSDPLDGMGEGPRNIVAPSRPAQTSEDEISRLYDEAAAYIEGKLGGDELVYDLSFPAVAPGGESTTTGVVIVTRRAGFETGRERRCEVAIGPQTRHRDINAVTSAIAHEAFHCWSHINHGGESEIPGWFEEGVASWVGEAYVGGSSYAANWWRYYFLYEDMALFTIEYPAIGFWSWVDDLPGVDLWARIPELHAAAASGASNDQIFGRAVLTDNPVESLSGLGPARFREGSWGDAWDMNGPGIRGRFEETKGLALDTTETLAPHVGDLSARNLTMPAVGGDGLLGVTFTGEGAFRARWNDGTEVSSLDAGERRWCVGPASCECPDGSSNPGFEPLQMSVTSPTLSVGAAGVPGVTTRVQVHVENLCDDDDSPACRGIAGGFDCHDEEEDDCLVGTWIQGPAEIDRYLNQQLGSGDLSFTGVAGTNQLILTPDGNATFHMSVTAEAVGEGVSAAVVGGGDADGTWTGGDGSLVFDMTTSDVDVVATAGPIQMSAADLGLDDVTGLSAVSGYDCGDGSLTLSTPSGPMSWRSG